jgi:hypothetical protein
MYLDSIFWFASWPVLVYASYKLVAVLIGKFEEKVNE